MIRQFPIIMQLITPKEVQKKHDTFRWLRLCLDETSTRLIEQCREHISRMKSRKHIMFELLQLSYKQISSTYMFYKSLMRKNGPLNIFRAYERKFVARVRWL